MTFRETMRRVREHLSGRPSQEAAREDLVRKYRAFRSLVQGNTEALEVLGDLQAKSSGEFLFDMRFITEACEKAFGSGQSVVEALTELSDGREKRLAQALERVRRRTAEALKEEAPPPDLPPVASLEAVADLPMEAVGAKIKRLAEIRRQAGIPVPDGFALTRAACQRFLADGGLAATIRSVIGRLSVADKAGIQKASDSMRARVLAADWPEELARAILTAYDDLLARSGRESLMVSVRSSAVGEDGEFSFAGQFSTVLNVGRERLLDACKEVVASQFSPRAVVYFKARGLSAADLPMAIGVVAMVDARASGVLYTRSPDAPSDDLVVLAGGWGLGITTVDGSGAPDVFTVRFGPEPDVIRTTVAQKERMLLCREGAGLVEVGVPGWMRDQPCLTREQALRLAEYGRRLEAFYGRPQDVEWTLDERENLIVLQSRPLRLPEPPPPEAGTQTREGLVPLLRAGSPASRGAAAGPVFAATAGKDPEDVPEGAVLVVKAASPEWAAVIDRVAAIVAEAGSSTSHLATVAREFRVPAVFGAEGALAALAPGRVVTVDADTSSVFDGRIDALLAKASAEEPPPDTPLFRRLRAVLAELVPLNLTDPRARQFKPSGCKTLHDVLRYAHEKGVQEMFLAGGTLGRGTGRALRLESDVPLDFYLIDLGGGLQVSPEAKTVTPGQFLSIPLVALWQGITEVPWDTSATADGRGMASVMMTAMTSGDLARQMAEPNYVITSDCYMNLSFRLGFHFSRVDAMAGGDPHDNYASFLFYGGAADTSGRSRRVDFLSRVLMLEGWRVERRGDALFARLSTLPGPELLDGLRGLGRLLVATRQVDTLMVSDAAVERAVTSFRAGDFGLGLSGAEG